MQRTSTSETPFNLAFWIEAVIPLEVELLSPRVENFDEGSNPEQLKANPDLLEKVQECVVVRMATYQWRVARYHNAHVWDKFLKVEDLVLRRSKVS